jgi:hypothetical protein
LRLHSQGDQDLCAAAAAGHLMFKTSTEDQTVDLTNKGMTKDSARFSRWFHSAWRTAYGSVRASPLRSRIPMLGMRNGVVKTTFESLAQYRKFRETDLAIIS